ncbi:MAG: DUF2157 domain-containing protein [Saprospiraceae bacterium]|nr:DUF2157 domain-containing protein [Saprospiraceae bacterium]
MVNKKYIKWLYEQLPEWLEQGLIGPDQAEKLRTHYGETDDKPDYNIAFIVAGILGALLIGGGIVLIVAYNWEDFSKTTRTILSFAPLIVAQIIFGYAYFQKRDSIAWAESTSAFLMLMVAASIALVSQTYHIWGDAESFLFIWLALSIPLMYLLNSSLVTIIYLIGIASWTMQIYDGESVWYWALLAAALPHLFLNLRKQNEPIRRNLLGWGLVLSFIFGWFGTIENNIAEYNFIGTALIFSLFYLLGQKLFTHSAFIYRPFQVFAVSGAFITLLFYTYATFNFDASSFDAYAIVFGKRYEQWAGLINFTVLIIIALSFLFLFFQNFIQRKLSVHFIAFLPFFAAILLLIGRANQSGLVTVLANLFLLAWGIAYLVEGIRERKMGWVNLGMLFILVLATARFFDTDWSFVVKGVAFIILGAAFLTANWVLARRLKSI